MIARFLSGLVAAVLFVSIAHAQEFRPSDWNYEMTGPGSGIQHLGTGVRLLYRPHLVSKSDWNAPSVLSFSWQPTKAPEKAADGHVYGDHLVIFFSSDGSFQEQRSYEMKHGIAVRMNSVTGDVSVATAVNGDFTVLGSGKTDVPAEGVWKVTISDKEDGTVSVVVGETEVVLTKVPASARKGKKWGFYNREPVANATNVSTLVDISRK